MTTIVLDSGGLSALADPRRGARVRALLDAGIWPPVVPSIVLVESLAGTARDASINRLLKACEIVEDLPRWLVRRAARLRHLARRGSAVDAVVVALAEQYDAPIVLTSDPDDLEAMAAATDAVVVRAV